MTKPLILLILLTLSSQGKTTNTFPDPNCDNESTLYSISITATNETNLNIDNLNISPGCDWKSFSQTTTDYVLDKVTTFRNYTFNIDEEGEVPILSVDIHLSEIVKFVQKDGIEEFPVTGEAKTKKMFELNNKNETYKFDFFNNSFTIKVNALDR